MTLDLGKINKEGPYRPYVYASNEIGGVVAQLLPTH
jgi:hypothetical protein